MNDNIAQF